MLILILGKDLFSIKCNYRILAVVAYANSFHSGRDIKIVSPSTLKVFLLFLGIV